MEVVLTLFFILFIFRSDQTEHRPKFVFIVGPGQIILLFLWFRKYKKIHVGVSGQSDHSNDWSLE